MGPGDKVPSNTHFTTTSAWCFQRGAEPVDFVDTTYFNPDDTESWFKGNIDLAAFKEYFISHAEKIPVVDLVVPNNLNGGMGVSMANIRGVREIIDQYAKRDTVYLLDIARISENAWLIKQHEEDTRTRPAWRSSTRCCPMQTAAT